jgi:hypothetical protein
MLTPRERETDRLILKGATTRWEFARRACVERLTYYAVRLDEEILASMARLDAAIDPTPDGLARFHAFSMLLLKARPSLIAATELAERPPETEMTA